MYLNGVSSAAQGVQLPQPASRRIGTERAPTAPARGLNTPVAAPTLPGTVAPAAQASVAEAPTGADPELWSVLNAEERAFFAKMGGMGPLTYSHMIHSGQPTTAVVRGGRIDVRA